MRQKRTYEEEVRIKNLLRATLLQLEGEQYRFSYKSEKTKLVYHVFDTYLLESSIKVTIAVAIPADQEKTVALMLTPEWRKRDEVCAEIQRMEEEVDPALL